MQVRMTVIKTSTNNKCWRKCGEKRTLLTLLMRMQISTATMKNSMEFFLKAKIELPYDPAFSLLDIYPE